MTCLETFATLRIFSDSLHPDEIGAILGIPATESIPKEPKSRYRPRRQTNFWGWCTKNQISSTDNLVHINMILTLLKGKQSLLEKLRSMGCSIDICNYWLSSGQGGPKLNLPTIRLLSEFGLEVWWDMYFGEVEQP